MDCVTSYDIPRPDQSGQNILAVSSLLSRTFLELVFLLLLVLILDPHFHFPAVGGLQLCNNRHQEDFGLDSISARVG